MSESKTISSGTHRGIDWWIRPQHFGYLCGYIRLPLGHPWIGKTTHELMDVEVHGGVTYSEVETDYYTKIEQPSTKQQWFTANWIVGFDCGHWCDIPIKEYITARDHTMIESLNNLVDMLTLNPTTKNKNTIEDATAECIKLADQAADAMQERKDNQ